MNTWFEVKVKYYKIAEDGNGKGVSECFLFDAVSWTDAETRTTERMPEICDGDFVITAIKKSNLSEILPYDLGEWWFRACVDMVTLDEEAGREKKVKVHYLVMSDDIQGALDRIKESLKDSIVDNVIASVSISNIIDVFPYIEDENKTVQN